MEKIPVSSSGGLVGDYVTHVIENGPWSVWLHIFSLVASATAFVLAFRSAERTLLLRLCLLPLALGLAATCVHAFNLYMTWGSQIVREHTSEFRWAITIPLRFSVLLTSVTVGVSLIIRKMRPTLAPQPTPSSRRYFYRSADGSICGPSTESQLRAMHRMGMISTETPVADAASPSEWATFGSNPILTPTTTQL
jgi:hypothetical protein